MHSELKDERFKTIKVTKKGVIHYGLQKLDIMLNDTIKEMDVYKEFIVKCKRAIFLIVQPQPVVPTQGTHKKSRVEGYKEETSINSKEVKETYIDDPDQIHAAILLSAESERLRLEIIKREQRMAEEEIIDDVYDTLEVVKNQKLKGIAKTDDAPKISPDAQLLLDLKEDHKLSRREGLIQELSGGPGKGSAVRKETQYDRDSLDSNQTPSATRLQTIDERDKDDASNFTVTLHPLWGTLACEPARLQVKTLDRFYGVRNQVWTRVSETDSTAVQMVDVPEVTMTKPTRPNQRGSTLVNPEMHLTPWETLNLGLLPGGNPELTSCTSVHVLRTEQISLTTTPTLSTTNITIPELKEKLYEMMSNNPESIE
ncbi:hypothetical protein Tco_0884588, partial [Tanacetum coccineum]